MAVSYRYRYSKTCLKPPLKQNTKIGFQDRLSLNAGQKYCRMLQGEHSACFRPSLSYHFLQKYCRMLQGEHSAILSTFIKLPFSIKTFVLLFLSGCLRQALLYSVKIYRKIAMVLV